jgi:small subunit ribosomal protein S20
MPITSSATKAMRQSATRRTRRQPVKTKMKTMIRKITLAAKEGNAAETQKLLPQTYKAIDMAAKKHLIHWKNAARKKAGVAKLASVKK